MTNFLRRLFPKKQVPVAGRSEDPAAGASAEAASATTGEPARCANCERVVQFDDIEREDSAVVEFLAGSGSVTTFCPACADIERQWRETGVVSGDRPPLALKSARMLSPEEVREMFGGGEDTSSKG